MYWAGFVPNTYNGGGDDCCCCSGGCCQSCCAPLAFLIWVFPVLPENAWGGLFGYIVGTHHMTPENRLYTSTDGGNPFIEFLRMGWLRPSDNHSSDAWRTQVYDFLQDSGNRTAPGLGATGPRLSPSFAPARDYNR